MASKSSSDGYVTLTVLVVAGLLASLVSSLVLVSRPSLDLARLGAEDRIAESVLDAGLTAAGYRLFLARRDAAEVSGLTLRLRGGTVRLAVAGENGRIDLNSAAPELIAGLFGAVGGASLTPAAFASRVADWRDKDADPGVGGAELREYEAANLDYGPRDGPFASVAEMRLILGLSRSDYDRLAPFLTVFSRSAGVDPLSAPRVVLSAVPGMSPTQVESLLAARQRKPVDEAAISAATAAHAEYFRSGPSRVFRVRMDAALAQGRRRAAEAVLVESRNSPTGFGIVAWSPL